MAPRPTAAQRRAIDAADPVTGRLTGQAAQLTALVRLGLAFRHPRPPHAYFLTPAGQRIRDAEPARAAEPSAPAPAGVFAARLGGEEAAGPADPARRREVRSAWQGLLELRRMTTPDGATDRPCGWERSHLAEAAALALEASGQPPEGPAAPGYRVRPTPQPEAVAVHARDETALRACAAALTEAGWQVSEHTEPRTRARYLLASPRKV
ncbi:hypothetical protein ACGFZL_30275 [Streptomyces sp. NPDC048182]|uniref:hypothetical protein n=1 Tax=Streptomyces sp. NPDC048182 TaxID=3365507 RepID=UPI00371FCE5E